MASPVRTVSVHIHQHVSFRNSQFERVGGLGDKIYKL